MSESSSVPKLSEVDKDLSLGICKVLDEIGASEETRRLRIDTAITREILHTITTQFVKGGIFDFFVFGSLAEGTTIRGLNSDVDYVYCINEWNVINAVGAASTNTPFSLLMVSDETTKPGYVKLQAVLNGTPQTAEGAMGNCTEPFQLDQRDRVVFCRPPVQGIVCEEHGPAWSIDASLGFVAQDHVMALRCQVLPECIKSLFRKVRKHNWPPADLVEEMKSFGVFLVPVGHPESPEKEREWRLSTSLQERLLMHSLNPTQYKCYVLLKLIKNDILLQLVGEESISSYVLKTCIFYVSEDKPNTFWRPNNIVACLQNCLECLLIGPDKDILFA